MDKDNFLFTDKIESINASFVKNGWATIYESHMEDDERYLIYCYLFDPKKKPDYKQNTEWEIDPAREGKPSIWSTYSKGREKITYTAYPEKGIEPFLFVREFRLADGDEDYVDVSEEFVFYFKLYERGRDKQNRTFYFVGELGELDEVIKIESNKVQIKVKYLLEYISIRKLNFCVCFHFVSISGASLAEFGVEAFDEEFQSENYIYTHLVDDISQDSSNKSRSLLHGKAFIFFDPKKSKIFYFAAKDKRFESFIVGYDQHGEYVFESCEDKNENAFKLTYFKKEVLNKYLNEPTKYEVDGWTVRSRFFLLQADNQHEDYVAAFVTDLSALPYKEQLHWKHYNIAPQAGISNAYYKTMLEARWVEAPEAPDLYFKHKYASFNKKWEKKFGWHFYKPLAKEDEHYFTALHIPTTNNVKAFGEQILGLVKITIDRLNEAEFAKSIELAENDKGLTKLEKYLRFHEIELPDMMKFLRSLQDLRSGLIAHGFSKSNKSCQKAIQYFGLKADNYREVAKEIFINSITTLHTLENLFDLKHTND